MWPFSVFQYCFRCSRSTPNLLTVLSDRIARVFNISGPAQAIALCILKAFYRVWHAGLLHKLSCMKFRVTYLALFFIFSVIDDFEWFQMGSFHKNILLILELFKVPFLAQLLSYYTLMTFLMLSLILLSMLMILLSSLNVIRHLICGNKECSVECCYLEMLEKLPKRICRTVDPSLAASHDVLATSSKCNQLAFSNRYYFGRCLIKLAQVVPLPFSRGGSTRYSDRLPDFSATSPRCYKGVYKLFSSQS